MKIEISLNHARIIIVAVVVLVVVLISVIALFGPHYSSRTAGCSTTSYVVSSTNPNGDNVYTTIFEGNSTLKEIPRYLELTIQS